MICKECNKKNNYSHTHCFYCGTPLAGKTDLNLDLPSNENINNNTFFESIEEEPEKELELFSEHTDTNKENEDLQNENSEEPINELSFKTQDSIMPNLFDNEENDESEKTDSSNKKIASLLAAIPIFILIFVSIWIFAKPLSWFKPKEVPASITYRVEDTTFEERASKNVIFDTNNISSITILGQTKELTEQKDTALFTITEVTIQQTGVINDGTTTLEAEVRDIHNNISKEIIAFPNVQIYTTFNILSPPEESVIIEEPMIEAQLEIDSNAILYINEEDYTDKVIDGKVTVSFEASPINQPIDLVFKVVQENYLPVTKKISVTYVPKKTAILFDQTITAPIVVENTDDLVVLTGQTDINAEISPNNDVVIPSINQQGQFSIDINPTHIGYSLYNIEFKHSDGTKESKEIIVDYTPSKEEYVTTAWAADDYSILLKDPAFHNGAHFTLLGTITKMIEETDDYIVLEFKLDETDDNLYRIEFWGDVNVSVDDHIKIFGNKWGIIEGQPRILAKEIILK